MSFDHCSAGRAGPERNERGRQIAAARDLLAAALAILDRQHCWHAAATVDLAIHQLGGPAPD